MNILLLFDKPAPLFPSTGISITTDIPTCHTELNALYKNIALTFSEEHNNACYLFERSDINLSAQCSYFNNQNKMLFHASEKRTQCIYM